MALSILQTRRKEPETQKRDVTSSSELGFEPLSVWLCPFRMSHGLLLIHRAYLRAPWEDGEQCSPWNTQGASGMGLELEPPVRGGEWAGWQGSRRVLTALKAGRRREAERY